MTSKSRATSLFDDIFQLQTTVPDIDPEDPEDGFKSGLTQGATEVEDLGSTTLRKQAAIIPDDPKYRGKKTSRKALYSDEEDVDLSGMENEGDLSYDAESDEDDDDDDSDEGDDENDITFGEEDGEDLDESRIDDEDDSDETNANKKDATVTTPSDSSDREKGKAVSYQLGLWDDLIKCRISLQKIVSSCNRLPTSDTWGRFAAFPAFQKESSDAHSSLRQVLTSLLELQEELIQKQPKNDGGSKGEGSDEEITSESEVEDEKDGDKLKVTKIKDLDNDNGDGDDDIDEDGDGGGNEEMKKVGFVYGDGEDDDDLDDDDAADKGDEKDDTEKKEETKRKLNQADAEVTLAKRHKTFQSFRNQTLSKWDEKTRLSHAKIKSKNFTAFDISVLKQIQQVLGNRGRLIRRIHQNRSSLRVLGQMTAEDDQVPQEIVVEDDEDEVEVRQRAMKPELDINYEVVDDSDFYQMCLRDFIQLKQNEETDPVLANKHWLEIQNMRKKHKRKVDTRASKGRKIRYHVKEKLKNFMAPYDKSTWSEEQKDDLFKALFGGNQQASESEKVSKVEDDMATINIGL